MADATNPVDVTFALDREQIAYGQRSSVHVVTRLRVPAAGGEVERPPLSVVLALDVSASMAGDPLLHVVRSAERIAALLRPADRLGIVAFSDRAFEVTPLRPADDTMRRDLARALGVLRVQSRTNVEDGLRLAHRMVRASSDRGVVILLSDGQPNVGASRPVDLARIAQAGTAATATLGYGPRHDERVLGAIADGGGGRYAFVAGPQLCQLELGRALGSQGEAVVEDVRVRLAAVEDARLCWLAAPWVQSSGAEATARLPDLAAGSNAVVAARIAIAPERGRHRAALADVEVSFRVVGRPERECTTRRLEIAVGDLDAPPRPDVLRAALLAEAGQRRRDACELADRGRFTEAASLLEEMSTRIRIVPGLASDTDLSEALEQIVDDIDLMRRHPDQATYAAFRRGQRELWLHAIRRICSGSPDARGRGRRHTCRRARRHRRRGHGGRVPAAVRERGRSYSDRRHLPGRRGNLTPPRLRDRGPRHPLAHRPGQHEHDTRQRPPPSKSTPSSTETTSSSAPGAYAIASLTDDRRCRRRGWRPW